MDGDTSIEARLDRIRESYDAVSAASPNIPESIWKQVATGRSYRPPEFEAWPECGR
jgi:hypothetical protein